VDLEVLRHELDTFGIDPKRVGVDRNAMIIEEGDKERERGLQLRERLSSTLCGVGSAVARRALRGADVRTAEIAAQNVVWLEKLITNVSEEANSALDAGKVFWLRELKASGYRFTTLRAILRQRRGIRRRPDSLAKSG